MAALVPRYQNGKLLREWSRWRREEGRRRRRSAHTTGGHRVSVKTRTCVRGVHHTVVTMLHSGTTRRSTALAPKARAFTAIGRSNTYGLRRQRPDALQPTLPN